MTREEAVMTINFLKEDYKQLLTEEDAEALDMAIEALKNKSRPFGDCSKCIHAYGTLGCCTTVSNEWVYDCEHGMEQYKSTKAEPSDDGTLEVKVEDATKVGRVLISDDKHRGGLYYPDEDEPKSDLISRADAIRVVEKNSYRMAGLTEVKLKCEIEELPSADRPKGEWIETAQDYYETVNKKDGGVNENTEYFTDDIACSECLTKFSNIDNETERFNFCPNCGADMRGEDE